jgi:hypothetical protein
MKLTQEAYFMEHGEKPSESTEVETSLSAE